MLEGKRIVLRLLDTEDVLPLTALLNDQANFGGSLQYVLNAPADLMALVEKNNMVTGHRLTLGVVEKETGALVGTALVYPMHARYDLPEVAVTIYPPEKRKLGFGFEVVALLASFLFLTRPIPRVTVVTNAQNTFLVATLTAFGFVLEATMRKACFYAGAFQDHVILSMLRPAWEIHKGRPELEGLRVLPSG